MSTPTEAIQAAMKKDPVAMAEMMEQFAPIVKALMDDQSDQLEERLMQMGTDILRVVTSIYAIRNTLVKKGICTEEEINEESKMAHQEMQDFLQGQLNKNNKKQEVEIEL